MKKRRTLFIVAICFIFLTGFTWKTVKLTGFSDEDRIIYLESIFTKDGGNSLDSYIDSRKKNNDEAYEIPSSDLSNVQREEAEQSNSQVPQETVKSNIVIEVYITIIRFDGSIRNRKEVENLISKIDRNKTSVTIIDNYGDYDTICFLIDELDRKKIKNTIEESN